MSQHTVETANTTAGVLMAGDPALLSKVLSPTLGVATHGKINNPNCFGEHRFFVAEVVANQSEGTVFVLAICTACGELKSHKITVGHPGDSTRLFLEEKKKGH